MFCSIKENNQTCLKVNGKLSKTDCQKSKTSFHAKQQSYFPFKSKLPTVANGAWVIRPIDANWTLTDKNNFKNNYHFDAAQYITINIVRPAKNDRKIHAFTFLHNMLLFYVCAVLRNYTSYKATYQIPKESTWN
jgi:hypothetical protein